MFEYEYLSTYVDMNICVLLQALDQSAAEVEEVEGDVQQMLGEVKRQGIYIC
jgi:hypothetical protein